jgi:hypothetical protein
MSNEKTDEKITDERQAQLKGDLENNLNAADRDFVREQLAEMDKPKEKPPAPDYASMSEGEFQALKSKLIK